MPHTARLSPRSLVLLATPPLFWAGNFIVARAARGDIPPMALSLGRWVIALLVLLPFAWPHIRRDWRLMRAHWRRILALALPGVAGFNALVYLGLQTTTATNGMLLNSTIPALILGLGAVFWGQSLRPRQVLGLVVSTLGVALVILRGAPERLLALDVAQGDLVIFCAMVAWAVYTMGLKTFPAEINRIGLLAVQIVVALIVLTPLALWEAQSVSPVWSVRALGALLFVGVVPSVLAYLLYMRAVALAGPALAGQFIHLIPVYGALLSSLLLGEALQPYHAAGFGLIVAGIWLASNAAPTKPQ